MSHGMTPTEFIWHNGEMKPWNTVTVHVLSHALHYGSSIFEGMRAYKTQKGTMIFRLADHLERMYASARVYRINIPFDHATLADACKQCVAANNLESAYIRPIAWRGLGGIGVAEPDNPVEVAVAAFFWGAYLGEEGLKSGIDVGVSSWNRVAPNTIPAGLKAGGNYLSSQLITMEAQDNGYSEGVALTPDGLISEGAGQNLFFVKKGRIYTPPAAASILVGITRDTVMTLARDLGYEVIEQPLPREMLYVSDEIFFTGTAVEITPVRSVDRLPVGTGERPVTAALQKKFFGLFNGRTTDHHGWLEPVTSEKLTV